MRKRILQLAVYTCILFGTAAFAQQINLQTQVKGLLAPVNGGTGLNTSGLTGCPQVTAGTWSIVTCSTGSGSAAGGNYAIQFSNGGAFAGANFIGFVWNNGSIQPPTVGTVANLASLGTLSNSTSGNAASATALATTPTLCGGGTSFALGIAANGNAQCGTISVSSAFSALTSGTNTTAAMLVGTGASLGVSGTGTIIATGDPSGTFGTAAIVNTGISGATLCLLNASTCTTTSAWTFGPATGTYPNTEISSASGIIMQSGGFTSTLGYGTLQMQSVTGGLGTTVYNYGGVTATGFPSTATTTQGVLNSGAVTVGPVTAGGTPQSNMTSTSVSGENTSQAVTWSCTNQTGACNIPVLTTSSGNINATTIGLTTPGSGAFTTLTSSGAANFNSIGATTPGTGVFNTLSSGALSHTAAIVNTAYFQQLSVTSCTTASTANALCSTTISLPVTEPDTNYSVRCTEVNPTANLIGIAAGTLTTTSFIWLHANLGSTGGSATLQCLVVHF